MTHFYDAQARGYEWSRRFFLWGRGRIVEYLGLKEGEKVLEVGCGTGWNLKPLAGKVGKAGSVTGMEISRGMLAEAERKKLPPQVRLVAGDATLGVSADPPIDAALFSYSFSAIPEPSKGLRNVISVLSPAGRIGIVDFCTRGGAPGWVNGAFLRWGKSHSCDFAADPRPVLLENGFEIAIANQFFGFSYRLIATRKRV
jgi:S-adenosylmethionine-diacylgycerolhomoserine-N-methlytransferase